MLLTDDDAMMRTVVREWLRRSLPAALVHETADAEEGLAWLDRAPPGPLVVVSDYSMSGMDGLQFLTLVRARRPEARRFLLTAYSAEELGPRLAEAALDGYLEKGLVADEFLAPLRSLTSP